MNMYGVSKRVVEKSIKMKEGRILKNKKACGSIIQEELI